MGTTFGAVIGTDSDIGSNAILFYHIIGNGKEGNMMSVLAGDPPR